MASPNEKIVRLIVSLTTWNPPFCTIILTCCSEHDYLWRSTLTGREFSSKVRRLRLMACVKSCWDNNSKWFTAVNYICIRWLPLQRVDWNLSRDHGCIFSTKLLFYFYHIIQQYETIHDDILAPVSQHFLVKTTEKFWCKKNASDLKTFVSGQAESRAFLIF